MARNHSKNLRNQYISGLYAIKENIFEVVEKSIEENDLRQINIDEYEGQILKFLISICNAKEVIEVGTLAGYSTLWIASALPKDGKLFSFEYDKRAYDVAKANIEISDYKNNIELIFGNAHEELNNLPNKQYDAIFIDAEKRGYPKYLDWAEKHIKKGGVIIADNSFLNEAVYDETKINDKNIKQVNSMKEFNIRLANQEKYQSIILPTVEGLSVAKKLF